MKERNEDLTRYRASAPLSLYPEILVILSDIKRPEGMSEGQTFWFKANALKEY